jgi:hypothetical protein
MAHFVNPSSGNPINRISVLIGKTVEIGVWGPWYPPPNFDQEYKVEPDTGGFVSVAKTQQGGADKAVTANIRSWTVTGNAKGSTALNIKTQEGWAAGGPLQVQATDTLIAWANKVSPEFKAKVIEICQRLQMDPSDLMACMNSETAGTLDPHKWNGDHTAVGLIQFTMPVGGKTLAALAAMDAVEQLDYVAQYGPFASHVGLLKSAEEVYTAMAWPAAIGKDSSTVFYERDKPINGIDFYRFNPSLDKDGDGKITKGELGTIARDSLQLGLRPGNAG